MRFTQLTMAVVLTLGALACAQAPTADIDAAQKALDDAGRAQASDYASEAWTAAKDAEAKLQTELEAQKQKWTPLRSYQTTKELAQLTKREAERASQEAVAAKERTKGEASDLLAQAREAHQNLQASLATAPRGKGTEADLASMKSDSATVESQLTEAQQLIDSGDYLAAKTKAQAALDTTKQIQAEIDEAKTRRRAA